MPSGLTLNLINRDETQLKERMASSQTAQVSNQGAFQQPNTACEEMPRWEENKRKLCLYIKY